MSPEVVADYACDTAEGPVWDPAKEVLYWLDIYSGRIFQYDPTTDTHEQIYEHDGAVGGLTLQSNGGLLLFGEQGAIWEYLDGDIAPVIDRVPVESHTRFNDVAADSTGGVLCGTKATPVRRARLYHLTPNRRLRILLDDVGLSNGIGFSTEGRQVYYVDSWTYRVDTFTFDPAQSDLSDQRVFVDLMEAPGMPDGLTVDADGYVWVAHYGGGVVSRYGPNGVLDQRIHLPVSQVTSLAFGGTDLSDLYITTGGGQDDDPEPNAGALFQLSPGVTGREEYRSTI